MIALSTLAHPLTDIFLLGFVVATALVALMFFLRFWKSTHDPLFLAFALFFAVQCFGHIAVLQLDHPNEGSFWLFLLRLLSVLGLLGAILWKNVSDR